MERDYEDDVMDSDGLRDLMQLEADLYSALGVKYGESLEYGEGINLEVEREKDFVRIGVVIEDVECTSRVEWEVARLAEGQPDDGLDLDDMIFLALDYLDELIEDYFANDRFMYYNDDWREVEYRGQRLRTRSAFRRPKIDSLADAWLAANGDPALVGNGFADEIERNVVDEESE